MLPSLTTKQMREVDRIMVEEYGIGLLQMTPRSYRAGGTRTPTSFGVHSA